MIALNTDVATTAEPAPQTPWPPAAAPGAGSGNFPYNLQHTLGFLNVAFWKSLVGGTTPPAGFSGNAYPAAAGSPYVGDARDAQGDAFPWIAWNNRPYASPWELLMVPSCHPARLLWEYQVNPPKTTPSPYTPNTAGGVCPYNPYAPTGAPRPACPIPTCWGSSNRRPRRRRAPQPQLYRLLEYVGIPSRFVQAETFINPTNANGGSHPFHPPFNRLSHYREPGRININTIYSQDVFNGLMNYFPGMYDSAGNTPKSAWNKFVRSRRGLGDSATDPLAMPGNTSPTRFASPFRSFAGGDFNVTPPPQEIEATLLRSDPDYPAVRPLFQIDASSALPNPPGPANDPDRNPFFRYQALSRLGNLVTTRSNVYAVWITVGYFQVAPVAVDPAKYPDGYQLGPELGSDTGEIERHRAFYIFDRTIPVGFIRGQDLNVEKGFLLKRYIE